MHDKSESKFVADMAAAKWPTHYIALNSFSGKSRALYLIGYDTFADMEKDNNAFMKDTALPPNSIRTPSPTASCSTRPTSLSSRSTTT